MDYEANTTVHQGNVSLIENKMKCMFINEPKLDLYKIKVDRGLIKEPIEKCDYIVHWLDEVSHVFYVELKGSDVPKALSQLIATIDLTKEKFANFTDKNCVIVCSRYPQEDSTIQRFKKQLHQLGYTLHPKSRIFEYKIKTN